MASTEKVYPDWVQAQRVKGTTVKKKGDSYYLYKRTSKRVPGKKYPQPVDTYIGIITPQGVIQTEKKKVSLSNIVVKEFGYSKAVWELCPESWKKAIGVEWEDVLKRIIIGKCSGSCRSLLCRHRNIGVVDGLCFGPAAHQPCDRILCGRRC